MFENEPTSLGMGCDNCVCSLLSVLVPTTLSVSCKPKILELKICIFGTI